MDASVVAVNSSPAHTFGKANQDGIRLLVGLGVDGDAHAGATVKHRSRVTKDPTQPNLRQVHLLHVELLAELSRRGFAVQPGEIGENITTRGLDLLALPTGSRLYFGAVAGERADDLADDGAVAVVEVTGLRNPCVQLDRFQPGLMAAVLDRDAAGNLVRKAGVMGVVRVGGVVRPGDGARVELPAAPHRPLTPV
jgi:MOSC domain-containing protein YiiM